MCLSNAQAVYSKSWLETLDYIEILTLIRCKNAIILSHFTNVNLIEKQLF